MVVFEDVADVDPSAGVIDQISELFRVMLGVMVPSDGVGSSGVILGQSAGQEGGMAAPALQCPAKIPGASQKIGSWIIQCVGVKMGDMFASCPFPGALRHDLH